MPVRFLSDPELARLSSWPDEIAEEDVVTYFTLTADDESWLAGSTGRTTISVLRFNCRRAVAWLDSRRPDRLPGHCTRSAR